MAAREDLDAEEEEMRRNNLPPYEEPQVENPGEIYQPETLDPGSYIDENGNLVNPEEEEEVYQPQYEESSNPESYPPAGEEDEAESYFMEHERQEEEEEVKNYDEMASETFMENMNDPYEEPKKEEYEDTSDEHFLGFDIGKEEK